MRYGMPSLVDAHKVDAESFPYIYEENVVIPLQCQKGVVRANLYRPKSDENARFPVLVTYGPYGKDIHYNEYVLISRSAARRVELIRTSFHAQSFSELPEDQKSAHSAWETPDPGYWTSRGYAIVRADEVGLGQSPGFMDTMSASTSACFKDIIEWAAEQPWSTGKIGLLGISYYAGSQWRVAARRPKGLSCIIPWEGMSDYYRDRCRHGGILSNTFISFWWYRQVVSNQYGLPGRAARKWGRDTIEGDRSETDLISSRRDQNVDNETFRFRDDEYYASREYNLADIEVPLLSVANWGGILLHLRGNVQGYLQAGSKMKFLRFLTGRHDLPFYTSEWVALQESFLNAFLKGEDGDGWTSGKVSPVGLVVRKGDVGYNDAKAEKAYPFRFENEWPLARTKYVKYYLSPSGNLSLDAPSSKETGSRMSYEALGNLKNPQLVQFSSAPFSKEVEFTGHIVAHLHVSCTRDTQGAQSSLAMDLDLFLTLRHLLENGTEVLYTGTVGDPVPISKGWLRTSLRKINPANPKHKVWDPYREYLSSEVDLLSPETT